MQVSLLLDGLSVWPCSLRWGLRRPPATAEQFWYFRSWQQREEQTNRSRPNRQHHVLHALHIYCVYCKYPDITIIFGEGHGFRKLACYLSVPDVWLPFQHLHCKQETRASRRSAQPDIKELKLWETASLAFYKSNNFLYAFINIAYMFNMQTQQCVPV